MAGTGESVTAGSAVVGRFIGPNLSITGAKPTDHIAGLIPSLLTIRFPGPAAGHGAVYGNRYAHRPHRLFRPPR